jgi:hypothetical protein
VHTLVPVETVRPRLDLVAFTVALGLLASPAIGFVYQRNGAAAIMSAMCLAGLVAGRLVGVPGRVLLPVAFGLVVVLWLIWVDSPVSSHTTSAFAHVTGGTLAGWALVETLRRREPDWLLVAFLALTAVIALTLIWEIGEYAGDRLMGTSLIPSKSDSAEDIVLGTAGGVVGIALGRAVALWRQRD